MFEEIDVIMKEIGYLPETELNGVLEMILCYVKEEEAAITVNLSGKTFIKENEYGPMPYTKEEIAAIDKICEYMEWGKEDIND